VENGEQLLECVRVCVCVCACVCVASVYSGCVYWAVVVGCMHVFRFA